MSEFKKGQLVAVSSGTLVNRRIRIFCGYYKALDGEIMYLCRESGESEKDAVAWPRCVPLEDVEPDAFVGWERRAGEQAAESVAMESELVQRLRRQVAWLCKELEECKGFVCPPKTQCVIQKPCRVCWEEASHKAVEDKTCPPVKKLPRWDDDPQNGTPECCIHWSGPRDSYRLWFRIGHPDRISIVEMDGKTFVVDEWTQEWQRLRPGCLVVVERGGRTVVI